MQTTSRIIAGFQYADFSKLELPMIVVYDHPLDFPDSFVARAYDVSHQKQKVIPTDLIMLGSTLNDIRKGIPDNFFRLERSALDDENIVESWV